jgi:DNA-binding transcriptional MerR regulator
MMAEYIGRLLELGLSAKDIRQMISVNPQKILGL